MAAALSPTRVFAAADGVLAVGLRVAGMLTLRTYHFSKAEARSRRRRWNSASVRNRQYRCFAGPRARFSSPFGHPTGPTAWIAPIYPASIGRVFQIFGVYSTGAASGGSFFELPFFGADLHSDRPDWATYGRKFGGLVAGWIWAVVPLFMGGPLSGYGI